jgi:hypothetical protein
MEQWMPTMKRAAGKILRYLRETGLYEEAISAEPSFAWVGWAWWKKTPKRPCGKPPECRRRKTPYEQELSGANGSFTYGCTYMWAYVCDGKYAHGIRVT